MDKQQQVRDFLESKVKEKGLSLNALSLKLGKNATYLFHFVKRNSPRRLDETTRRKLAQLLDVNEQDLCDFALPSGIIPDKLSTLSNFFNFNKNKNEDIIAIDVIDMDGPNKGKFEHVRKNIIGKHLMTVDLLKEYSVYHPENVVILKVAGDSMSPTVLSGDLIWIDMTYSVPSTDGIYVLNTAGDIAIRRIQTNPFDNSLDISSDNKSYRSFKVTDCKSLNICGKVIALTHKLS